MNNLLSICCVSYNHASYIKECIESIWNNDYKNIEIIALDDGSSDNSLDILNELKQKSPFPMTVISQQNSGNIGANFNKLFRKANGEFISIIACDDAIAPNSLKNKMDILNANKNVAFICHSKVLGINEKSEAIDSVPPLKLELYNTPTIEDLLELDYEELNSYYVQGAIIRKEIVDTIGGFDEDMLCDDIILRTKLHRYMKEHPELTFKIFKEIGVLYRRHSNNISSNSIRQVKGVLQYLGRYWEDRVPSRMFYDWLKHAINSKEDFLNIFVNDDYKKKVLASMSDDDFKNIIFPNDFPYKKRGIPHIFEVLNFKTKERKKLKVIKLFGITILKYKKSY